MNFELKVSGETLISRKILRVADRVVDLYPAWGNVADEIRGSEQDLFATQGQSSGRRWDDLQPATIAAKARAGFAEPDTVLVASGALRTSLTDGQGMDPAAGQIVHGTSTELVFGTQIGYAQAHQLGRGVPQRRPVDFPEDRKRAIMRHLQRYVLTGQIE